MSKVKELRLSKGLQQEEMARALSISLSNYSKKENGKIRWSLVEAKRISEIFQKPIEVIFFAN